MVAQSIQNIFEKIIEEKGLYAQCSRGEIKLILRYHVGAILGLFQSWGPEDRIFADDRGHIPAGRGQPIKKQMDSFAGL